MNESVNKGLERHFKNHAGRIQEGARRLGYKVAFNSPAIQEQLGLDGSLVAGLAGNTLHESPADCSLAGATRALLEPELAVLLARDLPATADVDQAAAAVGSVAAAIELVNFDRPFDEFEDILAEGVLHRAFTTGELLTPPPRCDLHGLRATIKINGETQADLDCLEATGDVPKLLVYLARLLDGFEARLEAGDIIICGSMTAPVAAKPGSCFEVELSNGSVAAMRLGE